MPNEVPYSKINPRELKDLEAEFGRTLTPELAQCLIRYRINRDAIELMLRKEANLQAPGTLPEMKESELSEIEPGTPEVLKSEEAVKRSRTAGPRRAARKAGPGNAARKHKRRRPQSPDPKPILAIHAQDAAHPLH